MTQDLSVRQGRFKDECEHADGGAVAGLLLLGFEFERHEDRMARAIREF
jgi:hypothetical protein